MLSDEPQHSCPKSYEYTKNCPSGQKIVYSHRSIRARHSTCHASPKISKDSPDAQLQLYRTTLYPRGFINVQRYLFKLFFFTMSESPATGTTHDHQPPSNGRRARIPAKKPPKRPSARVHKGRIGRKHANRAYGYDVDPSVKEHLESNGYVQALDWAALNNSWYNLYIYFIIRSRIKHFEALAQKALEEGNLAAYGNAKTAIERIKIPLWKKRDHEHELW